MRRSVWQHPAAPPCGNTELPSATRACWRAKSPPAPTRTHICCSCVGLGLGVPGTRSLGAAAYHLSHLLAVLGKLSERTHLQPQQQHRARSESTSGGVFEACCCLGVLVVFASPCLCWHCHCQWPNVVEASWRLWRRSLEHHNSTTAEQHRARAHNRVRHSLMSQGVSTVLSWWIATFVVHIQARARNSVWHLARAAAAAPLTRREGRPGMNQ